VVPPVQPQQIDSQKCCRSAAAHEIGETRRPSESTKTISPSAWHSAGKDL
jgi:hypothetical protein